MAILSILLLQLALAAPGDVVSSFPSPGDWPGDLAWDGRRLWCPDARRGMLFSLDPESGEVLDSLPSPGPFPQGLTWGQDRLYVSDRDTKGIYVLDPGTGNVEGVYPAPGRSVRGLAWGEGALWAVDDADDMVYKLNPDDGAVIGCFRAPSGDSRGLCFDGKCLWVSDRTDDEVYMVTTDGTAVLSFRSPGSFPAGLAYDGRSIWISDFQNREIYKTRREDDEKYSVSDWRRAKIELQHIVMNSGPGHLEDVRIFLAVPLKKLENQEILDIKFSPEPEKFVVDRWGQKVAICSFPEVGPGEEVSAGYVAEVRTGVLRYYIFPEKVGSLDDIPKDIEKYLADGTRYRIDDPLIRRIARRMKKEENPYWMARKIHNYVLEHVRYEAAGGWDAAPVVLKRGSGSCSESAFAFIALCRAAGLPARFEAGSLIRGDLRSVDYDNHRWGEVYLPNYGWVPFDPSIGKGHSPAGVLKAVGRSDVIGGPHPGLFVTTHGGGDSEYLGWQYNSRVAYTPKGRCDVKEGRYFLWEVSETP